jgi:hypothetical protein
MWRNTGRRSGSTRERCTGRGCWIDSSPAGSGVAVNSAGREGHTPAQGCYLHQYFTLRIRNSLGNQKSIWQSYRLLCKENPRTCEGPGADAPVWGREAAFPARRVSAENPVRRGELPGLPTPAILIKTGK